MEPPFWYKVAQMQLGFKEFLDRYNNNNLFQEKETLPIFIFACLNHMEPYVAERHILGHFINERNVSDRSLQYFYLYWIFAGNYGDDTLIADSPIGGTMSSFRLKFPVDFAADYLMNWIAIILRSFFCVGPLIQSERKYTKRNFDLLSKIIAYAEQLNEERFIVANKTVPYINELMQAHETLVEIKQFLSGKIYPNILYSYRQDRRFVSSVIEQYWPVVLKTLDKYRSFDDWELNAIRESHQKLYEMGDVDFLFYYIDLFKRSFGEDHSLSMELDRYVKTSKENDRLRVEQYLRKINPNERRRYLPQYFPVSDTQVENFAKEVERNGFETAIYPYMQRVKTHITMDLQNTGAELLNPEFFSSQTSIYLYSPTEYILVPDGKNYYVFLLNELHHLKNDRKNPYNRADLPDYIFLGLQILCESKNLEELWSSILRRKVELNLDF